MLNFLIALFTLIGIIALIDIAVFTAVFIRCGFKVPTRQQYFDHVGSILVGLGGGVGFYFLIVIAFCI